MIARKLANLNCFSAERKHQEIKAMLRACFGKCVQGHCVVIQLNNWFQRLEDPTAFRVNQLINGNSCPELLPAVPFFGPVNDLQTSQAASTLIGNIFVKDMVVLRRDGSPIVKLEAIVADIGTVHTRIALVVQHFSPMGGNSKKLRSSDTKETVWCEEVVRKVSFYTIDEDSVFLIDMREAVVS
jgi:hypothetical protein